MRLLLLNQFTPPDTAPTSRLLGDLASRFAEEGWDPVLVGARSGYRGSGPISGGRRLLRDALAHLRLLLRGLRAGPCDWVVCLSDPPALPFTALLLARLKGARLAHWAMDVYPEVAVRLGALPEGPVSRLVGRFMTLGYRHATRLVALDEDMRDVMAASSRRPPDVLPPWPPALDAEIQSPNRNEPSPAKASGERVWLYSGNLGRAHEFRDLLEAQRLLEQQSQPWRLVFQGGGPSRAEAQALAASLGLQRCDWLDYADDARLLPSLNQADVLVATQKDRLRGLLWPSKLALLQLLDRPILWVGPSQGRISATLRTSPIHGVFAPGDAAAIARWLSALPASPPALSPAEVASRVGRLRQAGLDQWVAWLRTAL